ncbi:hypothetical protein F4553_003032 [Allocatelliglobosispora scoriae]|uniref:Nucleotide exchange factor GrpE n=1 Tax=Allocatelliglobosispora scoriae TaxID=643052 RepID=A0A841BRX1_9ACTN|nr:hypothetical protein [Allocatelliglobosispora scoriae]MBB5869653.1 hypothetical protein [Allocatelliglobosispora scoriae]
MTRPGKPPRDQTLAGLFAVDADAAVLGVLRQAGRALTAAEVKAALLVVGVAKVDADRAWPVVQKRLKTLGQVSVEGARYRWVEQSAPVPEPDPEPSAELSAEEALELLLSGKLAAARKAALAEIVRTALLKPADPKPADPKPADTQPVGPEGAEAAARQRQAEIDGVRALAELASEVEELLANETEPAVMTRQVRAWVKRSGLEPIDRAGEETTFDRKLHKPIGPAIGDGAPVIVVRPGYVWKTPGTDVLIGKAIVEE